MYLRKSLRSYMLAGISLLAVSVPALAEKSTLVVTMDVEWEPTTTGGTPAGGPSDVVLTSESDTWVYTIELDDFELAKDGKRHVFESDSAVEINIVATTPVPDGVLNENLDQEYLLSRDSVSSDFIDPDSPVIVRDKARGTPIGYPDWATYFNRDLYLPAGTNTDEAILDQLSSVGSQFRVHEMFDKQRIEYQSRYGIATVTSVVVSMPASCELTLINEWQESSNRNGFLAEVTIKNTSDEPINGWALGLNIDSAKLINFWNAELSGSGSSIDARNLEYNAVIQPGQSMTFGLHGSINSVVDLADSKITGAVCQLN